MNLFIHLCEVVAFLMIVTGLCMISAGRKA